MKTIESFLRRTLILQVRSTLTASSTAQRLHSHNPFSSPLRSLSSSAKEHSSTVSHLINSFGFSQEVALSVSKYIRTESPEKLNSFLAMFNSHGFSQTQISKIVQRQPPLLQYHPDKILLPKLQFFYSKGASRPDVVRIMVSDPTLLRRSLENHIIPSFNFFKDFFQSDEMAMALVKRFSRILLFDPRTYVAPNINALQELGVPKSNVEGLLRYQPRVFMVMPNLFREIIEMVKKMEFNPSKYRFVGAVHAMRAMTKSTWDRKVGVFKSWGWSEEDIGSAFRKFPWCMTISEDKIIATMDFLVNKMGRESSSIAKRPAIIAHSLEKRIIPRYSVVQVLLSKGLIEKDFSLSVLFESPEKKFLHKFVNPYTEEAPQLLKLYQENIKSCKEARLSQPGK